MPKSPKQKQKLLYIAEYLLAQTDENHCVTTKQIIEHLGKNGITAERKSIYSDIETLCEFGMDIIRSESVRGGYQVVSRDFELAEVKLLVDLVQSSKFITMKKSRELISKLEKQVSKNDAGTLQRQVVVADRNKTNNENIYYSVDVIYDAIAHDSKVRYHYFEWDTDKRQKLRKDGMFYEVSPWILMWDDENYYLVAYDEEAQIMKHYRVDKMLHIERMEDKREGRELYEKMDIASFSKKTFGMFAGEECTLRLLLDQSLTGVVIDRFGSDVSIRKIDDKNILVRVNVAVSPQFFGWVAGFGTRIQIESPQGVRDAFGEYIRSIAELYDVSEGTSPKK